MPMTVVFTLLVLFCFQLKHFVADYVLQAGWMVRGKGDLTKLGGYAHAGVHVAGSLIVLAILRTPVAVIAALLAAEFVIHYALDYAKISYSRGVSDEENPHLYWTFHGFDQFLHHLTYIGMTYFALLAKGL